MNSFYNLNKVIQWLVALVMILFLTLVLGYWFISNSNFFYLILIAPIFQFLVTPFFTLIGTYKYLSPMLLTFSASKKLYDLHNGTSFDYLMVMKSIKPGTPWQRIMLKYYIEGLLSVITKIEQKELPETVIVRGSSYFFSNNSAQRLGFEVSNTSIGEKTNVFLNYIDIIWMYSLAKGKLTFPNINQIKTAKISGKNLLKSKPKLKRLMLYLNER